MSNDVLTDKQARLCEQSTTDYSDLNALFVNCKLKRSPEVSNTQGLMDIAMEIMRLNGVAVECIRAIDHDIAVGVWPDMTEHGWERDEWPEIFERVMQADILVLGMAIWWSIARMPSTATRLRRMISIEMSISPCVWESSGSRLSVQLMKNAFRSE